MKPPKHIPRPVRKTGGARATKLSDQMASQAAHFDNYSVEQFAYAMRIKLAVKRQEGRGGWQDKEFCSGDLLSQLLREHIDKGDPVDVANFCMMLHQRGERIIQAPQPNVTGPGFLEIAKLAGNHDIRYPTNAAMQAFLDRILSDFQSEWEKRKDPALIGIAEEMTESGGHWQPCTGCYDTEDGHPTQKYDFSPALQTAIGCGCHECGGLGAVWWHMTDAEIASYVEDMDAIDDDAIDAIQRLMDKKGLTRKDLFPAKSRASEYMSRKRPLSIATIRKLHFEHGIPAEVLIAPYRATATEGSEE